MAFLDEFYVQIATWQGQTAQIQQTVYSCQYLTRRDYFEKHNPLLVPYIDAFHYLSFEFYQAARGSMTMRDEDISFPPANVKQHKLTLKAIIDGLKENIEKIGGGSKVKEALKGHMMLMKTLLAITMNVVNKAQLKKEILDPLEEEVKAAAKKNKKKGKKDKGGASEADKIEEFTNL